MKHQFPFADVWFNVTDENAMKDDNSLKCISMEITVMKFVIWTGKPSFYSYKLRFTAPMTRRHKNDFSDHITEDLPPKMTILSTFIP